MIIDGFMHQLPDIDSGLLDPSRQRSRDVRVAQFKLDVFDIGLVLRDGRIGFLALCDGLLFVFHRSRTLLGQARVACLLVFPEDQTRFVFLQLRLVGGQPGLERLGIDEI